MSISITMQHDRLSASDLARLTRELRGKLDAVPCVDAEIPEPAPVAGDGQKGIELVNMAVELTCMLGDQAGDPVQLAKTSVELVRQTLEAFAARDAGLELQLTAEDGSVYKFGGNAAKSASQLPADLFEVAARP